MNRKYEIGSYKFAITGNGSQIILEHLCKYFKQDYIQSAT